MSTKETEGVWRMFLPLPASPKNRGGEDSQKLGSYEMLLPLSLGRDVDEGDRGGMAFLTPPGLP